MNDTRSEIVGLAEELIRTKGYNAFSYADISQLVGIKNATIHYYFPSKSDLGAEVIKKTIEGFKEQTAAWSKLSYEKQFVNYISIYDTSRKKNRVCIMGALLPVYDTLAVSMQAEVEQLANLILDWLTDLFAKGKEAGVFHYPESPKTKAYLIQSSLLASLLFNKVLKNSAYQTILDGILINK